MLEPQGDLVPEWGAKLVIKHHKAGYDQPSIARMLGCSIKVVRRILRVYRATGCARQPQQGRGRQSDPRWVFAGHDGPANRLLLCDIKERGRDDDLLTEVYDRVEKYMDRAPAYSTMTHTLRSSLGYSSKRVSPQPPADPSERRALIACLGRPPRARARARILRAWRAAARARPSRCPRSLAALVDSVRARRPRCAPFERVAYVARSTSSRRLDAAINSGATTRWMDDQFDGAHVADGAAGGRAATARARAARAPYGLA